MTQDGSVIDEDEIDPIAEEIDEMIENVKDSISSDTEESLG